MNILQCLLLIAALASLFVTGPNMVPVQSYAAAAADGGDNGDYKITKDDKNSIHKDIDFKSDSNNQHLGQDNLCYRDDDCEQTNEGEQIKGKDNAASGFNDQSKNIEQQPAVTTPPTPTTGILTVAKHVVCNFTSAVADCPTADLFNITVSTGNGSSISFNGSEAGTSLTINPQFPVTYQITETSPTLGFVVATIPVGDRPFGIAFNPTNKNIYVANFDNNTISVIDSSTNTVSATIPVGSNPSSIAFNPDNGFMYVANAGGSGNVSVIDPFTNTVVATIPVDTTPSSIAFNPDNGFMYVANRDSGNVSVIDPSTNTVVATIPVAGGPVGIFVFDIAFNPYNGFMYVAITDTITGSGSVSVIDPSTNTVVATITLPVRSCPIGIALNPDNGFLYVTDQCSDNVSVINPATNTVIGTIPAGSVPYGIAFSQGNGNLYITNIGNDAVSVIDPSTNTVVATIPVGSDPRGIALNPDNGFLYVANSGFGTNTVSVIAPLTTTFSEGCNGTIGSAGQTVTCTVTNAYGRPA